MVKIHHLKLAGNFFFYFFFLNFSQKNFFRTTSKTFDITATNVGLRTEVFEVEATNGVLSATSFPQISIDVCLSQASNAPILSSPSDGQTFIAGSSISLVWSASSISGYDCLNDNANIDYVVQLNSVNQPSVQVTTFDAGVLSAGSYTWSVFATNGFSGSAQSNEFTFNICGPSAPGAVTDPNVTGTETSPVIICWSAPSVGEDCGNNVIDSYNLYLGTTSNQLNFYDSYTSTCTDAISLNDDTYFITIEADNGRLTTNSAEFSFDICTVVAPDAATLAFPADNSEVSPTGIILRWQNPSSFGEDCRGLTTSVTLELIEDSGNFNSPLRQQSLTSSDESFNIGDLTDETTYRWRIITSNLETFTISNEFIFATTLACADRNVGNFNLVSPTDNEIVTLSDITFDWGDVDFGVVCDSSIAKNEYSISITINSGTAQISTVSASEFDFSGLQHGDSVSWQVTADNGQVSSSSSTFTFTVCIPLPPDVPVLDYPSDNDQFVSGTVSLSWLASANAGRVCLTSNTNITYVVYLDTLSNPQSNLIYSGSDLETGNQNPGLNDGDTYYWAIVASNAEASSQLSTIQSFVVCKASNPTTASGLSPSNAFNLPYNTQFSWLASVEGKSCIPPNKKKRQQNNFEGLRYNVYLGTDQSNLQSSPNNFNVTSYTPQNDFTLTDGTWYWLVETLQNTNEGIFSVNSSISEISFCNRIPPEEPTLNNPPNNEVLGAGAVSFDWVLNVSGAGCGCNGCRDLTFYLDTVNTFDSTRLITQQFAIPASGVTQSITQSLLTGNYFWQVIATDNGNNYTSEIFSFDICIPTEPEVPTNNNRLPLDNPTFSAAETLSPSDVTFQWEDANFGPCSNGGQYKVYLGFNGGQENFFTTVNDDDDPNTVNELLPPALITGNYTWYLTTSNGFLESLNSTDTWSFRVCKSDRPSSVTLNSPRTSSFVVSETIELEFSQLLDIQWGEICQGQDTETRKYKIYLDEFPNPTNLLTTIEYSETDPNATSISYSENLEPGIYYWYVQTENEAGERAQSQTFSFEICRNTPPGQGSLIYPQDGSVDIHVQDYFEWNSVEDFGIVCLSNRVNRQVSVFISDNETVLFEEDAKAFLPQLNTRFAPNFELSHETKYYWAIKVENGEFDVNSEIWSFTTRAQTCSNFGCLYGECDDLPIIPVCTCESRFSGEKCDAALCEGGCSENGNCIFEEVNNVTSCSCDAGFGGENCEERVLTGGSETVVFIVVPILAFICIIFLVVAAFAYRKRKKDQRIYVEMVEPEFEDLAFLPVKPGSAAIKYSSKVAGWEDFENLLLDDQDFTLLIALCRAIGNSGPESDTLSKALVYFNHKHDRLIDFMRALGSDEVGRQESNVLFRTNTMFTKSFKIYSRLFGLEFLYRTFGRKIFDMLVEEKRKQELAKEAEEAKLRDVELGSELLFDETGELDPEKTGDMVASNLSASKVKLMITKFYDQLLKGKDDFPRELIELLQAILEILDETDLDDQTKKTLGGSFVFLRYVNPAIVAPENYGLCPDDYKQFISAIRRDLLNLTKVLQNLANKIKFGTKEKWMITMNTFIDENMDSFDEFFQYLLKESPGTSFKKKVPKQTYIDTLRFLFNHVQKNKGELMEQLDDETSNQLADIIYEIEESANN